MLEERRLDQDNEQGIRDLLFGRKVKVINSSTLLLDNDVVLEIIPNTGCGGCGSGNYELADFLIENKTDDITEKQLEIVCSAVRTHMGQWTKVNYSKVVLKAPSTKIDRFVHMCDYLASRKCLEFNFDV